MEEKKAKSEAAVSRKRGPYKPRKKKLKTNEAQLVEDLASILCTMEEMSKITKMSVEDLDNQYGKVIENARANGKSSLRRLQLRIAREGNATMAIFLGKVLLNQREEESKDAPKFNITINNVPKDKPAEANAAEE